MILYRKVPQLRVRRTASPEPPFWAATTITPYGARRATPVAIDYSSLRASAAERLEVTVCENVRDELERARSIGGPVLIDAAGNAEVVFGRGAEALTWCEEAQLDVQMLVSSLPGRGDVILAAWPPRVEPPQPQAGSWGVAVPVIFPVTTELVLLERLADEAHRGGATYFAAVAVDVEPTAKQRIAQSLALTSDDDRYATLFHGGVSGIHLATERHIAALAAERGMADFILPVRWNERTNWNAAVLLTLTASRMLAMELDVDLAATIARSARTIAELEKPLTRIAEAASVSIVSGLDETSVEMLTEWLAGENASFAEYVNEQWRLRR